MVATEQRTLPTSDQFYELSRTRRSVRAGQSTESVAGSDGGHACCRWAGT